MTKRHGQLSAKRVGLTGALAIALVLRVFAIAS